MDALVEAAKKEGKLNVIALPPDWANYGEIIDAFREKYGIKINSANPDGASQDELNAVTSQRARTGRPTCSTSARLRAPGPGQDLLAPYKVETWDEIPEGQKDPTATGTTTTAATSPSAATPR